MFYCLDFIIFNVFIISCTVGPFLFYIFCIFIRETSSFTQRDISYYLAGSPSLLLSSWKMLCAFWRFSPWEYFLLSCHFDKGTLILLPFFNVSIILSLCYFSVFGIVLLSSGWLLLSILVLHTLRIL